MEKNNLTLYMPENVINNLKSNKSNIPNNIEDLVFQVSDWDYCHEDLDIGNDTIKKYIIKYTYGTNIPYQND